MKPIKICSKCSTKKIFNKKNFPVKQKNVLSTICRNCYNIQRKNRKNYFIYNILNGARRRAKEKNMDYNLTVALNFPSHCPVLDFPLISGKDEWFNSPTIDRIDNKKGYTMDNVIVISALANMIKSCATPNQILKVGHFYKNLFKKRNLKYETE